MRRRDFLKLCVKLGMLGLGAIGFTCLGREREEISKKEPEVYGTYLSGTSAGDAETLNWILAADSASFAYAGLCLDSLAIYDNQFNIHLRHLAKPIEVSEDGLIYTITIRNDLKWSDGRNVTADDYVYTIKNLMMSDWLPYNYKDDWREEIAGEKRFVEVEKVSETVFQVKRRTIDPEFVDNVLHNLTPYPKHIAEKYVQIEDEKRRVEAFIKAEEFNTLSYTGNLGMFKFKEWIRNDKYVTERNSDYYLASVEGKPYPYFEKYIIKIFGSPAAVNAALEAGDITSAGIDPDQVARFKEMKHLQVYTYPTTGYLLLAYNLRNNGWEGLRNREVRQAFSMAIGKKTLIDKILMGFGEPAFSFIPKSSPWYTEEGVMKFGVGELYDKDKARQKLIEAGYSSIPTLKIFTNSGNKTREDTCLFIKQELKEIGVEVKVSYLPWATLLEKYLRNTIPNSKIPPSFNNGVNAVSEAPWDMIVIGFNTNPIAPSGSRLFFTSDGGLNFWGYFNREVDELFNRARSKEGLDGAKRREIYAELSRVIALDQPVDFLAFELANVGIKKEVQGIDPGIRMGWNLHQWYFVR
ncbi:MAG: ABC transporter substrate-binding protein [Methanocellales archaeon]